MGAAPAQRDGRAGRTPLSGRALRAWVLVLGATVAVSLLLAVSAGQAVIPVADVLRYLVAGATGGTIAADDVTDYTVVWQLRVPRSLLAALLGAGLALTGVLMQVLVRNPLADPFILGVSSGASVGAALVVTTGLLASWGVWSISGAALIGALLTAAAVWGLAGGPGSVSPLRLVLVGVVLGLGAQALMSLVVFLARAVLFWLLGSLGGVRWEHVAPVAAVVLLAWGWARSRSGALDVLALGDEAAHGLGVDVRRLRRTLFVVTAVVPGVLVAAAGAVGFVGLVVPHAVRLVVGPSHRAVLVLAPLVGALLCIWVDVASRVLTAPRELPLGVLTAVIGVPVFLLLLRRDAARSGSGR
ncbi:iron ABC transporter permease [Alteromonas gracilis]